MKSFERAVQKASDEAIARIASAPLKEAFERGGFKGLSEKAGKMLNLDIRYDHARDPAFAGDRERLNREAGLIISNHPGTADTVSVLGALDRKDVLFVVGNTERLGKIIPASSLIEASTDPGQARAALRSIEAHIANGGAVFFYPEGGRAAEMERKPFRSGFGYLLRRIPEDAMVYSFRVHPGDAEAAQEHMDQRKGMLSRLVKTSVLPGTSPATVRVDEKYSQASEWLRAFRDSGLPKSDFNRFLTDRYLSQFEY